MVRSNSRWGLSRVAMVAAVCASGVLGTDILQTIGFNNCGNGSTVSVQKVDIRYNNDNKTVTFDVAGSSSRTQNVTAVLNVTAYGQQIYSNSFNPCDAKTFVEQLCPVPAGTFTARGQQEIPAQFASLVPAIAFQIPDIAAMATLQLNAVGSNQRVACIQSQVTNGKTANVPAVSYVAAGVAGVALVMTGATAAGAAFAGGSAVLGGGGAGAGGAGSHAGGTGTISPSFTEVFGWFQGMAMNGMLSVNYPPIYRSFTKNFAFSTGIVPWTQLQVSIDSFRDMTGGDLSKDSVEVLKNSTLVFPDGSRVEGGAGLLKAKRAFEAFNLLARQIETTVNATGNGAQGIDSTSSPSKIEQTVEGITAFVQSVSVPQSNTFMTILLVVAIVIAAIAVGILLVKVLLEFWALFGNFPKSLAGFREHYWGSIGRAITSLILLLYGVWVLYCIFQFTHGDSWAAKTLAGVTLFLFTGILLFFSWKIWHTARKLKQNEGDASGLYDDKNIWVKYSLFYESYKKDYWWIFVPTIVYMFAKGAVLAAGDGHGLFQTSAQLIIEAIMLGLLVWSRPYERKSGNVINIIIQVVRVLSVVCILVFVEQFGIAQTTQTVTGVVLIAVQSALTGILAILIAWNAINACCKKNPHRQRRKEMEKMQRDMDNLTPLDARNSLLMDRPKADDTPSTFNAPAHEKKGSIGSLGSNRYLGPEAQYSSNGPLGTYNAPYRPLTPSTPLQYRNQSQENLVLGAAPIGQERKPTIPNLGGYGDYNERPYGNGYGNNINNTNQGYGGNGGFNQYSRNGY